MENYTLLFDEAEETKPEAPTTEEETTEEEGAKEEKEGTEDKE